MAEACSFDESNLVLSAPEGLESRVSALSVYKGLDSGFSTVVSCWKFTQQELDNINKTGRVFIGVMGETMPPIWVDGNHPFKQESNDNENS